MLLKSITKPLVILSLIIPGLSYSQLNFIPISADYTTFNMNDSLSYVEFYLSFFRSALQYKNANDTLRATFETTLIVKYNNEVFLSRNHLLKNEITDTAKVNPYDNFLDVYNLALPFRTFNITLALKDLNSGISGEYQMDASIPGPSDVFAISEIQLASKIEAAKVKGTYTKNGLDVIPHPRKTFDIFQPMLYYYVELNNLTFDATNPHTYQINYNVTNDQADTLKSGTMKTKKVAAKIQAEVGGFNAISLPHGIYYLNIWAKDDGSSVTSSVRKKFFVHKPSGKTQETDKPSISEVDADFTGMSVDDLQIEFDKAKYTALPEEIEIFSQLDSTHAMRKFLTTFWRKRDGDRGSKWGESRRQYLTLCDQADARFSSGSKNGWKTDRGRVLIIYGTPDEIERIPSSLNAKPYAIWKYYQLEGGSEFVFVDRTGFGSYELIHSTYYKELQNPNWQSYINESGSNFGF